MNDYDALRDYLKKQTRPEFVLGFDEIEEIIDARSEEHTSELQSPA